jgi:hypothetical protein
MRYIEMFKRLIFPTVIILFVGLFSGCEMLGLASEDKGTAPDILDAAFFPEGQYDVDRELFLIDDGRNYDFLLAVEDPDLDAVKCYLTETGPEDYSFSTEINLSSQNSSIMSYLLARGPATPPYGLYSLYLKVEDSKGNKSDVFQVNYYVQAP